MDKMKLGISYNLFDGEELLERSIYYIRPHVSYISVVYQTTSFYGTECSKELLPTLNDLLNKGYIDDIIEYKGNSILDEDESLAHIQQVEKRNIGLELSKKNDCNYHMAFDADEFYIPEEFSRMKEILLETDEPACALQHRQYYKDAIYTIVPPEQEYIIGIFKIADRTKFVYKAPCPVPVDPSRKPNWGEFIILPRHMIEMHHMSFVRKNIRIKLETSIAKKNIKHNTEKIVEYYNNWKYPMAAMWAGGNYINVVEIPRKFYVYTGEENDNS